MSEPADLMRIYLRDHDAAAAGGSALARRCASSNSGNDLGGYLARHFLGELETDHDLVEAALSALHTGPSMPKRLLARAGTVIGRAKLNGTLVSYSPLSRVVELEALIAGVHAKQRLWVSIELLARTDAHLGLPDVTTALNRAESQLTELQRHHRHAVRIAFAPDPEAHR